MDINTVRGLLTLLLLVIFLAIWAWAWSSKRKKRFDEASRLPFQDERRNDEPRDGKGDSK